VEILNVRKRKKDINNDIQKIESFLKDTLYS